MANERAVAALRRGQIGAASRVLVRAFFHDPMFSYILPDEATRVRVMPHFHRISTRYGYLFGRAYTTVGPLAGVAIWLQPADPGMSFTRKLLSGMLARPRLLGPESYRLFQNFAAHLSAVRAQDAPMAHWYLWILGVDPAFQGRGVGVTLLQPVARLADASGTPCYLISENLRNLSFYQRQGFRIVSEGRVPDGGPRVWGMLRSPAP